MRSRWLERALLSAALAGLTLVATAGAAGASGLGGVLQQTQHGSNTNSTDQDASADASTKQWNVNAPIAILSPGANGGDVRQSNDATTTAWAGNANATDQGVSQSQEAKPGGSGCHTCGGGGDQSQDASNDNETNQ